MTSGTADPKNHLKSNFDHIKKPGVIEKNEQHGCFQHKILIKKNLITFQKET